MAELDGSVGSEQHGIPQPAPAPRLDDDLHRRGRNAPIVMRRMVAVAVVISFVMLGEGFMLLSHEGRCTRKDGGAGRGRDRCIGAEVGCDCC